MARQEELVGRVTRALHEVADLHIAVEERDGVLTLSGRVGTDDQVLAAEDIVRRVAPDARISNNLEVETIFPTSVEDYPRNGPSLSDLPDSVQQVEDWGGSVDPDFTDQELLADPLNAVAPNSSGWEDPVQEGDEVYIPPTDPVVEPGADGDLEVVGGFSTTSLQEVEVERSSDGRLGDEAIADAIRRELNEDASTTDLVIDVQVREGIAILRGRVPDLQDADNAETVAATVPGVVEVREELEVGALRQ